MKHDVTKKTEPRTAGTLDCVVGCLVVLFAAYVWLSWGAFQWRNPKSNEMSFYRHFGEVLTWQKMEEYQ